MIGLVQPTLNNPDRRTDQRFLIGSEVAGREFQRALLCSQYEVGLFVSDESVSFVERDVERVRENIGLVANSPSVFGYSSIPSLMQEGRVKILHNLSLEMDKAVYARNRFGKYPIPVTCLVHGLSPNEMLWNQFASL